MTDNLAAFSSATESSASVLQVLLTTLEAREFQLRRRAERLSKIATQLGQSLNLDETQLQILKCGALLHDIGNIGIPDAILLKPSGLSDWEFQEIKLHPIIGEKIVSTLPSFATLRPLVRSHHEKLDGSGYPDGLKGEVIPLIVRVLSVADVYNTLRSVRAYRTAFSHEEALQMLQNEVERGWWDGEIVQTLQTLTPLENNAFEDY